MVVTAVARGRAHMTVLRREDVQSRVASWDGNPYRIASSPILAIVPLIIRRLRGPSPTRVMACSRAPLARRASHSCFCWDRDRVKRRPQEARELARDRDRDLRRGLVLFGEAPEAAAQSLLRLVRDRNHPAGLSLASSRER